MRPASSPPDIPPRVAAVGLLAALLLAIHPTLRPFTGHDIKWHLIRAAQWHRGVVDHVLYPRFLHDIFWGHGGPVMLFYSPLPYAITELFMLPGLGPVGALAAAMIAAFALAAAGMYALARPDLGRAGALVAAAAYTLAPYHLLDAYVRAAYPELLAMGIMPWVLLAARRAATRATGGAVAGLALASGLLILSHNLSAGLGLPLAVAYGIWHGRGARAEGYVVRTAAGLLGGLVLSCFYWLPAQAETTLIRIGEYSAERFTPHAHLVYPWQLVDPTWGFGNSVPGPGDAMSFQIGLVHIVALLAAAALALRGPLPLRRETRFWLAAFFAATLLLLQPTARLWEIAPPIPFLFPWRLLALSALAASWAVGAVVAAIGRPRDRAALAGAAITLCLGFYWPMTRARPAQYPEGTFSPQTLSAGNSAEMIWLPVGADPPANAPETAVIEGTASVEVIENRTHLLTARVVAEEPAAIRLRVLAFPGWKASIDGRPAPTGADATGAIVVRVPAGSHALRLAFGFTPRRALAAAVSAAAGIVIASTFLRGLRRRREPGIV